MKKLAALILSGALLLSAASCNKKDDIPFDYDLSKYVTLGEYMGVTYVPARTDPTDDEIWERIIEVLDYCGLYAEQVFPELVSKNITEGKVIYGDQVKMDISLSIDGESRDDCTVEGFETEIGGNFFTPNITKADAEEAGVDYAFLTQFMTDIEKNAVDAKIGSEYTITGTFPDDNFDNEVIGKEYVITAKVTEVTTRYGHPDTVEEDILDKLGDYEDFEEYREYIVGELEENGYDTSDGEIWHMICYEFKRNGFYDYTLYEDYYGEDLKVGTVKYGDVINIDFEGFVDGERYENACDEEYSLEIGSGTFIEGFEDGLVGAVIGNEVTLELTFPEDYHSAELAGKPVTFNVTVNCVEYRYEHPDVLSQEIMEQLYGYGMASSADFDEFWTTVDKEIEAELISAAESAKMNDTWLAVVENSTLISCPEDEIEKYMDEYEAYYVSMAEYYGYDSLDGLLQYMGVTYDEFIAEGKTMANDQVYEMMLMYQIARAEGYDKLEASAYEEGAAEYMEYYGFDDYATMCEEMGEHTVKEWVMADMVTKLVCDNAVAVTE